MTNQTQRVELKVESVAFATLAYPALLITGQAPYGRYHRVSDSEGLPLTLKTERLDDERMKALFR